MAKAPPRLTQVQANALVFIRSSLERTGTAPTLRELGAHMGYSAIGSAQDLVTALRKKGFLHTPDKQSARSLILTPKALALQERNYKSTQDTYVIKCVDDVISYLSQSKNINAEEEAEEAEDSFNVIQTLRLSVSMFERPSPDPKALFAIRCSDDAMIEKGILEGDYAIIEKGAHTKESDIVLALIGNKPALRVLQKDRFGFYLKAENHTYPITRPCHQTGEDSNEPLVAIVGKIIAIQRVF